MIAKVRIAPVERWCAESQEIQGYRTDFPGRQVEIRTETMTIHEACGARWWSVTNKCANELRALGGKTPLVEDDERGMCETMLEMD
jgi:hypothetical protein